MSSLASSVMNNLLFVLQFLGLVFLIFLAAYIVEKKISVAHSYRERILSTKTIALIGVFGAVSAVLMLLEVPVPFAPPFYKIDLSEVPALILAFGCGPVAGVMCEFLKILIKILIKGSSTAFVGELANFAVGCTMILPAGFIYYFRKTRYTALIGCIVGVLMMTCFGSAFNAVYLLPKFSELFGMPMDAIIGMGNKLNPNITSVSTMAIYAVAPLNLLKGSIDTIITHLLYKHLSPLLKDRSKTV